MIFGFATPHNHAKLYRELLYMQQYEGLPGFVPFANQIQIDYYSSDWLPMALYGVEL